MRRLPKALVLLSAAALAAAVAGCTQAEPPRSFVQPNAMRKSDLSGTWYYNATVLDAPPTNGSVYIGMYGELQKINWVISEDTLFAVRAYAFVDNQEDPQSGDSLSNPDGSTQYEGEPLAAWNIQSQFDIIRNYNPTTGEETNQIIESQERPWNEREYIRVDWSQNLVQDWTGIGLDLAFNAVTVNPVSYFISDPNSPDAMRIERADQNDADLGFASGEMNYFDVTDELVVNPPSQLFEVDTNVFAYLPSCFAFYGTEDCASQNVKLRNAFAKLAPSDTYEKREWYGPDQSLFGFFTTDLRQNWNRQYGDTYTGATRWVERFNLWKNSCNVPGTQCEAPHRVPDPNDATWLTNFTDQDQINMEIDAGQLSPSDAPQATGRNLSEAEAEAACNNNGQCLLSNQDPITGAAIPIDAGVFLLEGTDGVPASQDTNWIPYSQRQQRTIPYYPNENFPEDLWPYAQSIISSWNNAFKTVVADELQVPNTTLSDGGSSIQDVFVWCHNPVEAHYASDGSTVVSDGDNPICLQHLKPEINPDGSNQTGANGYPIYYMRQGDPRYSSILWINEFQAGGPLGLGPALADPETGETISSKANIYGGDLDTYAAWARDVLKLINGQLQPDQYVVGLQAQAWVAQNQPGNEPRAKPLQQTQISTLVKDMNFSWARGLAPGGYDHSNTKNFYNSMINRENHILESGVLGDGSSDTFQASLDVLRNTPLEAELTTQDLALQMGLGPGQDFGDLSADQKGLYSPLNTSQVRTLLEQNRTAMEAFGYDFEPFDYSVMDHEAEHYLQFCSGQGLSGAACDEAMWEDLRERIFVGVTLHEVGHNMGLRHNFRGSWDAMNYFPQYWNLRVAAAQYDHPTDTLPDGQVRLYARSNPRGALNEQIEVQGGELEYQYSSIMDYGAAFDTDLQDLGHYDKAAVKYGYANNVEVFTDASQDPNQLLRLSSLQTFSGAYGFPSSLVNASGFAAVNYYTYPELLNKGAPDLESRQDVNYYAVDNQPFLGQGIGASQKEVVLGTLDSQSNIQPMVPYYFGSDEFVGNLSCERFDFGADAYEQAQDIITRYKNFYLINNFKRDRYSFQTGPHYIDYIYNRYFEMLRDQLEWYVLLRSDFEDSVTQQFGTPGQASNQTQNLAQLDQFLADDENGWGSFTASIADTWQLFGEVLTMPNAGGFVPVTQPDGSTLQEQLQDTPFAQESVALDITQGRYEATTWDFTGCGYYWGDDCQSRIGYFIDKWLALMVLGESQAYFTGRDTSVDVRQYTIGYWIPFKQQILDTYGAMLAGESSALAPIYQASTGTLLTPNFVTGDKPDPSQGLMMDPEVGFSLQMWAGVYALAGFSSTFDHGFISNSQVFVVGNGEAPVPDNQLENCSTATVPNPAATCTTNPAELVGNGGAFQWLTFTDPLSGKTYAAHSVPSYSLFTDTGSGTNTVRQDVGARMLEHAALLNTAQNNPNLSPEMQQVAQTQYLQFQENLDMMRSLQAAFGYGPFSTDQLKRGGHGSSGSSRAQRP